jgi:hypothetical protein
MTFLFFIFTATRQAKLGRYIKRNDYKTWRKLTSIGKYGPGLSNPFKGISFLFKESDEIDEKLLRLKDSARVSTRYFLIWFATSVVTIISTFIYLLLFYP